MTTEAAPQPAQPTPLLQLARLGAMVRLFDAGGDRFEIRIDRPGHNPETFKDLDAGDALAVIVCTMNDKAAPRAVK